MWNDLIYAPKEEPVLLCCTRRDTSKQHVVKAIFIPPFTREEEEDDQFFIDEEEGADGIYDTRGGTDFLKGGWWEVINCDPVRYLSRLGNIKPLSWAYLPRPPIFVEGRILRYIEKKEGVLGGKAKIRDTRLLVSRLVGYRRSGYSDKFLIENFPSLSLEMLEEAWAYAAACREEIDAEIAADLDARTQKP